MHRTTRTPTGITTALASLASLASLAACKSLAADDGKPAVRPPIAADSRAVSSSALPARDAEAPTALAPEPPLAWGTRAPRDGVLFPIVDGMCIHGEVFPLENGALFAYGSSHGALSRGGTPPPRASPTTASSRKRTSASAPPSSSGA